MKIIRDNTQAGISLSSLINSSNRYSDQCFIFEDNYYTVINVKDSGQVSLSHSDDVVPCLNLHARTLHGISGQAIVLPVSAEIHTKRIL